MGFLPSAIFVSLAVSSSSALPLDQSQLQQLIQQLQIQFPSSGGITAEIPLPQFFQNILANLPSSPVSGRALDASQLPIPPVLQNIVQQVQSGNSVDTSSLPPFMTTFVNQLQTGTLPPLLQNLVSLIQSSSSQPATGRSEDVSADTEAAEELLKACYSSNYSSGYRYPSTYSSSYYYPGSLYTGGYTGGYPTGTAYTSGYSAGTGYPNIAIAPISGASTTGGTYPYNPYNNIYG